MDFAEEFYIYKKNHDCIPVLVLVPCTGTVWKNIFFRNSKVEKCKSWSTSTLYFLQQRDTEVPVDTHTWMYVYIYMYVYIHTCKMIMMPLF